jgi:ADP-ribosylation factor protein 1
MELGDFFSVLPRDVLLLIIVRIGVHVFPLAGTCRAWRDLVGRFPLHLWLAQCGKRQLRRVLLASPQPPAPEHLWRMLCHSKHVLSRGVHTSWKDAFHARREALPQQGVLSKLWGALWKPGPRSVAMIGLDAAGKSTLAVRLRKTNGQPDIVWPSHWESCKCSIGATQAELTLIDLGGQQKIRPLWRHFVNSVLVFVLDSNDRQRFDEACQELSWWLDPAMDRPVRALLVICTKQDLDSASLLECAHALRLHELREEVAYHVVGADARLDAVASLLEWLGPIFQLVPPAN